MLIIWRIFWLFRPCLLDRAYYISSDTYGITVQGIEKILKSFYTIFGVGGGFNYPSFIINQICYKNRENYSWFGYGPKHFLQALEEQGRRYSDAGIENPHHREAAGFVDDRQDFIFYIGLQPNVVKENRRITSDYVQAGFVFGSMPFDNRKFISFYEKANLEAPDNIYDSEYLNFKYINLRRAKQKITLHKEGLIAYKSRLDNELWTSGVICKNPFYGIEKIDPHLSKHEKIIINLRNHHPASDNPQYFLEEFRGVPIPYSGFEFVVLNIRGDW